MRNVVITGPTGAIGLALIKKCIEEQVHVYAICRPGSHRIGVLPKSQFVNILECDLDSLSILPQYISDKVEVFYHLGWKATVGNARNDMRLQWENIGYALDAVDVAAKLGCSVFVGAGSQAEYGRVEGKLSGQTSTFPENGYGMAKLCAGQMTRIRCEQLGLKHIWSRILSVYGPGDGMGSMVMATLQKLLNKERPLLTAGEQQWDYLFSEDCANALYLLAARGKHGKIYCLGSGRVRPLKEYICDMRDIVYPDGDLGFGEIPYAEKQVMYLCADITTLQEDIDFEVKVSFKDGIKRTIQWLQEMR